MMKKLLFLLFFVSTAPCLKAQNLHFSQYKMFPQSLNPALTGSMESDHRIAAIYRQQWKTLNTLFETTGISAETSLKNIFLTKNNLGVGLAFLNDDQGGIINDLHLGASFAYHHVFGANNRARISLGAQGFYRQTQIDYTSLQFSDQYEYFEFNPDLATNESLDNDMFSNFSLNAGIALNYMFSSRTQLDGGIATFNLLKPASSAFGLSEKTIAGVLLHSGVKYKLTDRLSTYPNLRIIYQGGSNNSIVGNEFDYILSPQQQMHLLVGASYRLMDAAIVSGGLQWKDLKIAAAYDLTVSKLNNVKDALDDSKGAGAFEIAMILELRKIKASSKPVSIPCKIF